MIDETDDAFLVAFIDDQLEPGARSALATRLVVEPALRARYEQLAAGGFPFAPAFHAALAEAPLARMQAGIAAAAPGGEAAQPRPAPTRWIGAAAAALLLLFLGWGIGRYSAPLETPASVATKEDDWRQAVAGYVLLYSAETFANVADDQTALAQLSKALGVDFTPSAIALPNLAFRRADLLAYDGAPLGQIAYLDGGEPVVFCIIRNGEKDAPVTARKYDELAAAAWAHGGRGYLVASRLPVERVAALAQTLSERF
jgi:anti-sigma factor RsiW